MRRLYVCSNDGAALLVEPDESWWQVSLSASGDAPSGTLRRVNPAGRFDAPTMGASIGTFFHDLAENWRGWNGAKDWESIEGILRLSARHDGLGTVSVRTVLEDRLDPDGWLLAVTLKLDAGGMDGLARDAQSVATP